MPQMAPNSGPCPCGSGTSYSNCCGPIIAGTTLAASAEALMRSRYTAHAIARQEPAAVDYILDTWAPEQRATLNRQEISDWAISSDWLGLRVIQCNLGQTGDQQGLVEFEARYRRDGHQHTHHERSLFRFEGGRWYFAGSLS